MRAFAITVVVGLVFLGVYVSAYYAAVERAIDAVNFLEDDDCIVPEYSFGDGFARQAFAPMHRVDRAVRRTYWSLHGAHRDLMAGHELKAAGHYDYFNRKRR